MRGVLAAAALTLAGCSVPLDGTALMGPVNQCSSSSACASDATCVSNVCVATSFDLSGLLVEVRPNSGAAFGAATSFIFDLSSSTVALTSNGASDRAFLTHLDLGLPATFSVVGGRVRVSKDTPLEQSCALGADRAIPAHLTFYRVPRFAGLPSDPIATNAAASQGGGSPSFDADLVPDVYDVYVEPVAVAGCNGGAPYPPAFFPGQPIGVSGAVSWVLPELPPVGHLTGSITGFGVDAPADLQIDLLEPSRGLPISANGVLTPIDGGYTISADIAWQDKTAPILRLTPVTKPDDPLAPTVYWALAGSLYGGSQASPVVAFTVDQLYSKELVVGGQLQGKHGFAGVPASITIQSIMLPGVDAENGALVVQGATTDAQGNFTVALPPGGSYQLRAFPLDDTHAITDGTIDVPMSLPAGATCFCGRSFTLDDKPTIAGTVKTPTGDRLVDAAANITPALTLSPSFWQNAHSLPLITARPASTTTGSDGTFSLSVDKGTSVLTIQPAAGSNFPWLVRPRLAIQQSAELSSLTLTSPAILSGAVTSPSPGAEPVPDAEVNAWFPIRDASMPGVVVKIATTSTDANGNYTLVLPSSL